MTDDRPPLLREFQRVSKDRGGREKSPQQQHDDHVRDGERHGFTLHPDPYREIGSASRYAKRERDTFPNLIADLRSGAFGADGLALWEGSRGSRKVSEWALLLDLLAENRKVVWIHTHGRMYDATNTRDRRTLLEEAVDAEYESGKTSDRLRRDAADRAANGGPAGRLSFAMRSVYDERTGRLVRREPDEESGKPALVRELFTRFVAGTALAKIEREWASRGIVNRAGNPFGSPQLIELLRNRVYIGERVHVPGEEIRWWRARERVKITRGDWKPILEGESGRELFFAAQAILDDPKRVTTRPGGARHMMSMIGRCDPCSGPLCAGERRSEWVYRCRDKGCIQVPQEGVDQVAMTRIVDYLSSKAVHKRLQQSAAQAADEVAKVKADLAREAAELQNLKAKTKARQLSIDFAAEVEPGLRARIAELEARYEELTTPSDLRGLIGPREDVQARLAEMNDIGRLRRVAQLVLSPPMAGQLRVTRSPVRGHRCPIEDRVVFLRATS